MITRRALVLSGTAAALLPLPSLAQSRKERERILGLWREQLQADLDAKLARGCGGRFSVLDFQYLPAKGGLEMNAVVQLDWPPGIRRRKFRHAGSEAQDVYRALRDEARGTFRQAWPDCIA